MGKNAVVLPNKNQLIISAPVERNLPIEDKSKLKKYLPYIIGGAVLLFGGYFLLKRKK